MGTSWLVYFSDYQFHMPMHMKLVKSLVTACYACVFDNCFSKFT